MGRASGTSAALANRTAAGRLRRNPPASAARRRNGKRQRGNPRRDGAAGEDSGGRRRDPEFSRGAARPGDGHDEGSRLSALGSRLSALGSYLQCDPQPPPRLRNPLRTGGLRPKPAPLPPPSERARCPPQTRLRRVHAEDGILAGPATVPWAAHTSTVVHPSRGQVEGSATRLPAPAAPAGWRFARPPPSRAGTIAASTQIACNSTKSYVKWV